MASQLEITVNGRRHCVVAAPETPLLYVVQTLSRALKEEVRFDRARVTSVDWASYPILTFPELPDEIDVVQRDKPPLGAGEPAACPIRAAVADTIFDATGARVRTMPFTPERVKAALERI
jgi:CO/xanthine dehydrogenase Mo-binding subunit